MTCYISRLQPELYLAIVDILIQQPWGKAALLRWSGTSTFYRSLLAPYLFQKLPSRNTEDSGASLDFIASSPYASYVQEIYFKGTAPVEGEEGFEDTESIFPDAVRNVLSNLDRFPKLETVQIEFDFDSDNKWPEVGGLFLCRVLDSFLQSLTVVTRPVLLHITFGNQVVFARKYTCLALR